MDCRFYPYAGELVRYLKFGGGGIVLGSSVGDKTETGISVPGKKFADRASTTATFTTRQHPVARRYNGPSLDICAN